jgi:hypothetical protein
MNPPRRPDPAADPGVDAAWTPALGLLAVAVGAVLGALAWWWTAPSAADEVLPLAAAPPPAPVPNVASVAAPAAPPTLAVTASDASPPLPPAAAPAPRIPRMRDPDGDQTPDLSDYVNEGERPTMSEVIARLNQAGVTTGLGAFAPPGTRPPLVGLAVPEDFELPDGYVRHHQATDDGERIEAILMFAPDRQFVDAAGQPIAIPADRVVPPELAPAGLPIRRIAIPARPDPGTPGS